MNKNTKTNILFVNDCLKNSTALEEFKEANEKIPEQQEPVIKEENLNMLFQMVKNAAHDLNQPLMSLQGNIDLMKLNIDKSEKLVTYMKRVETVGDRMAGIVRKIQEICQNDTNIYSLTDAKKYER